MKEFINFLADHFWLIMTTMFLVALYCGYRAFIDPFGWASRCPSKKRIRLKNGSRFMLVDIGSTDWSYLVGMTKYSNTAIGAFEDLRAIFHHAHKSLPKNCSILCLEEKTMFELVMHNGIGDIRTFYPASSYDGYLVLVKDQASVKSVEKPAVVTA